MTLSLLDFTLRVACAFALGALIGLERQWRQRMAGLRTNTLVATGSALFVTIADFSGSNSNQTQIAAYIVSGIGFLAGAVIFKQNFSITGLNTAGTMWASAAVGTLAGVGAFAEAAVGAAFILAVNVLLRPLGRRINLSSTEDTEAVRLYAIEASCSHEAEAAVRARLFMRSLNESSPCSRYRVSTAKTIVTSTSRRRLRRRDGPTQRSRPSSPTSPAIPPLRRRAGKCGRSMTSGRQPQVCRECDAD